VHGTIETLFDVEWRPLAELTAIASEWRALAARTAEPNVFYEPAFALAAAPVFGRDVGAGLVWSRSPRRLLGLFPARIERHRYGVPLPVLAGWTHPYAPLGTPLVDRDAGEAVIAAWLSYVAHDPRYPSLPKIMLLPFLPTNGAVARMLDAVVARRGGRSALFALHARALLAPTADRAAYLEHAIARKKRKELRRQRNRLAEIGRLTSRHITDGSQIAAALDDFLRLEAAGWKGRAGTAALATPDLIRGSGQRGYFKKVRAHSASEDARERAGDTRPEAGSSARAARDHAEIAQFMRAAVALLAGEGRAEIAELALDNRAVAALLTLRSGATAWIWKIAYDEAYARFSPGVQIVLDATQRLLADPGVARADSLAGADHPMIDHIWRERLALADRLIAVGPEHAHAFALARMLEGLRRAAISLAKALRDATKRA
jgi:CelD/BcsL family acetyltransferase involved in cellulose biosynthesis